MPEIIMYLGRRGCGESAAPFSRSAPDPDICVAIRASGEAAGYALRRRPSRDVTRPVIAVTSGTRNAIIGQRYSAP